MILVGLSGPLLSDLRSNQRVGDLESVLDAVRWWVSAEARADLAALRESIETDGRWVVFLLDALEDGGAGGWQVGTESELFALLERESEKMAVRGPSCFLLELQLLAEPVGVPPRGYLPLIAHMHVAPIPEPAADLSIWKAAQTGRWPEYTFHLVALP